MSEPDGDMAQAPRIHTNRSNFRSTYSQSATAPCRFLLRFPRRFVAMLHLNGVTGDRPDPDLLCLRPLITDWEPVDAPRIPATLTIPPRAFPSSTLPSNYLTSNPALKTTTCNASAAQAFVVKGPAFRAPAHCRRHRLISTDTAPPDPAIPPNLI
ncbi:uncharacterized protein CLUP02_14018 [Colletotrichum lupini]|uniref:Uncharacterized protein n=1 Tax=Colletotrichum lupini TaxID=145971 RepID=A0A9Q8WM73_9PEZI|nr:uncharacterized protein CLUP02_14018 [Colletotrichum lupini]UQC88494.1 hypothetical protein CLUP02_14018 [Colletotrichum lupini]